MSAVVPSLTFKEKGEEAMKRAEFWQALQAALGRLPERVAEVFTLREIDDLPSKEVCATLNYRETILWGTLLRAPLAPRRHSATTFFPDQRAAPTLPASPTRS